MKERNEGWREHVYSTIHNNYHTVNEGSIPKQVPKMNSAHLLAKRNSRCRSPRANWDAGHLVWGREMNMEVD